MTDFEKIIEDTKAAMLPYESWERIKGESGAAYAAFCAYRDYGPERNIRKAVEASFNGKSNEGFMGREERVAQGIGYSENKTNSNNSSANSIVKRYRTWRIWSMQFKWRERAADYDDYLDRLKQTERRKAIEAMGERHLKTAEKMLDKVDKKIDLMTAQELSNGAVVDWLEAATRLERETRGIGIAKDNKDSSAGAQAITFASDFEGL
jgi:hypothetical protein